MKTKDSAAIGDLFALPGELTLGGKQMAIPKQTPADIARTHEAMRQLAAKECTSPLEYVAAHKDLDPGAFSEAIRAAVVMGSGGGPEPKREAVFRAYETLDGVRWRVWYQANRAPGAPDREWINAQITEENFYAVSDALGKALGMDEKKAPASGPTAS